MPQKLLLEKSMRFLTREVLQTMAYFPADMSRVTTEIQTLMTQNLVHYYEREWHRATR
jgi:spermidine synthase